jgi:hypothetical protein
MSVYHVDLLLQNRYKQLLRASRQWRDLKSRMKSGLGHASEQEKSQDGSFAIFCPTCPQPGFNLPDNWKDKYSSYVRTNHSDFNITYLLLGLKEWAHPNIHHGWKFLRRAYAVSDKGEGCFLVTGHGIHGQSWIIQCTPPKQSGDGPGKCEFICPML